jgi:hypothetical protein
MIGMPKKKCCMCDKDLDLWWNNHAFCRQHHEEVKERRMIAAGVTSWDDIPKLPLMTGELITELIVRKKDYLIRSIYGNEDRAIVDPNSKQITYPRWYIWLGRLVVRVKEPIHG